MSRNISSFVIGVDSNIKTHQLPEVLAFKAKLVGIVGTIVETCISVGDLRVVTEAVVENNSSNS